jgi:integrase
MRDATLALHPDNHRLRTEFLAALRASGMPEHQVRQRQSTTDHLLLVAGERPLARMSVADLKTLIGTTTHRITGAPLSAERHRKIYAHARELLGFALDQQPHAFARVQRQHLRHLRPDTFPETLTSTVRRPFYTLAEMHVLAQLDLRAKVTLWRAQACACLQFLGGLRIGSLATLPLCAIDCETLRVQQDPRLGVRTKLRKRAVTVLLDLPDILTPVRAWLDYLRQQQVAAQAMFFNVFTLTDSPLPSDAPPGAHRAIALARDYRQLCAYAGLPYRGSHALRHGHIVHCARQCRDLSDFTALSQNVMHSDVRVTMHYAAMSEQSVAEQYYHFTALAPGAIPKGGDAGDARYAKDEIATLLRSGEPSLEQRQLLKTLMHELVEQL